MIRTAHETGGLTLVCGHDALGGLHLGRARPNVEPLTGAGVVVRRAPPQSDPLIAERTAGNFRAKDHFRVPESEKQEGLAAIVASKAEVLNG